MPVESKKPLSVETLEQAGRVWKRLSAVECAGLLYISLHYDQRGERTAEYIEMMAMLPWMGLGDPLQQDIARALISFRLKISDAASLLS